jgi:hypothetical protein
MATAGLPPSSVAPKFLDPKLAANLSAATIDLNDINARAAAGQAVAVVAQAHLAAWNAIVAWTILDTMHSPGPDYTPRKAAVVAYNNSLVAHTAQLKAILGTAPSIGIAIREYVNPGVTYYFDSVGSYIPIVPVIPSNVAVTTAQNAAIAALAAYNAGVAALTAGSTSAAGIYRASPVAATPWKQLWFYTKSATSQFTARSATASFWVAATGQAGAYNITRTTGSFVTDGWLPGDFIAAPGQPLTQITAVTPTVISLATILITPITSVANFRLYGSTIKAVGGQNFILMGIRVGQTITASPLVTDGAVGNTTPFKVGAVTADSIIVYSAYSNAITGTAVFTVKDADGISGLNPISGTYTPVGLVGITSSGNYLIAYSTDTIYWSSTLDQLDFTPSLASGAGSATPTDLQGNILACYPVSNGFLIVTSELILSAQYSGNTTFPWIFKVVSGGLPTIGLEAISHDSIDSSQVALTASGLCTIDVNNSTLQDAEISDFLKQSQLETWDAVAQLPVITTHTGNKAIKVTRASSRFICVSYGAITYPQIYTQAIVYDMLLKRAGKLVIPHIELFTWPYAFSGSTAKIAVCGASGSIDLVDTQAVKQVGVAQFGRLSLTRNSLCTLQGVDAEGASQVLVTPMVDGSTPSTPVLMYRSPTNPTQFSSRATAKGHNLTFLAPFDITYVDVTLQQAGNR